MDVEKNILVTGASLFTRAVFVLSIFALLAACGQKGNLYIPNDPEFEQRAKLPDIVRRQLPGNSPTPATSSPANAASAATGH